MHPSTAGGPGGGVLSRARHILRPTALGLLLCVSTLLTACQPERPPGPASPSPPDAPAGTATASPTGAAVDPDSYARSLVDLVNTERVAAGLPSLSLSSCAGHQARARAAALVAQGGALEHAPLAPVTEACAPASMSGENLSRAAAAPADVVDAWMASPGHRSNIVAAGFTETAVVCLPAGGARPAEVLCSQVFLGP